MSNTVYPRSPKDQIDGIPFFPRMCDKIRLYAVGSLPEEYHANLGQGCDLWTCQLLQINYDELVKVVRQGADDQQALEWAYQTGEKPSDLLKVWWSSYARNRGHHDDLSEKLAFRKEQAGLAHRDDIFSFFELMDVEEGRVS